MFSNREKRSSGWSIASFFVVNPAPSLRLSPTGDLFEGQSLVRLRQGFGATRGGLYTFLRNEPTGRGILVGFGCRDNYFAASRRTRFGKRTHRRGVFWGCSWKVGFVWGETRGAPGRSRGCCLRRATRYGGQGCCRSTLPPSHDRCGGQVEGQAVRLREGFRRRSSSYGGQDGGRGGPRKHVFLRNEPDFFGLENCIYQSGLQWVMQ